MSVCRLLRKDGIIKNGKRIRINWSEWYSYKYHVIKAVAKLEDDDSPKADEPKILEQTQMQGVSEPPKPKKPPNAWILYRSDRYAGIKNNSEDAAHKDILAKISNEWKNLEKDKKGNLSTTICKAYERIHNIYTSKSQAG